MYRARMRRVAALGGLLVAALVAQGAVSIAQPLGSELVEGISADLAGDEASIFLSDVSGFPASGEAVFEPGTINEEGFTYSSVDDTSNRLVGLSRPTPLEHSAGVFVEAPPAPSPTPSEATPAPDTTPRPLAAEATAPPSPPTDSSDDALESSAGSSDTCDPQSPPTCVETTPLCDPNNPGPTCIGTTPLCDPNNSGPGCISVTEPCDPNNTGQTCEEKLTELAATTDDGCDPDNTGQTCLDYFMNPSGSYSQPVETIIPVPDFGDGQDGIHQPCYLFTKVTRVGIRKAGGTFDAQEFADGYIRTDCEFPRVRRMKIQTAIFHHSSLPFFGATLSTQDSGEGPPPGPVYSNAFQEVRVFPDHQHGSRINFYFIYRATLRHGDQATAMDCFSMMYGFTQPTPVSCGEELPLLLLN